MECTFFTRCSDDMFWADNEKDPGTRLVHTELKYGVLAILLTKFATAMHRKVNNPNKYLAHHLDSALTKSQHQNYVSGRLIIKIMMPALTCSSYISTFQFSAGRTITTT